MKSYSLITGYIYIEGSKFPIEHPCSFLAKNERELKFIVSYLGIEYLDIAVVEEIIEEKETVSVADPRNN